MEASSIASSLFPPTLLCRLSTEAMLGTPKAGVQWGFTTVSMHTCSGTQLFLTLCDPMACSPPGSSVHGILQARVLEWGAIAIRGLKPRACLVVQTVKNMPTIWETWV